MPAARPSTRQRPTASGRSRRPARIRQASASRHAPAAGARAPGWRAGARGPGRSYSEPETRRNRRSRTARTACHSGRSAKLAGPAVVVRIRSGSRDAHRLDAHRCPALDDDVRKEFSPPARSTSSLRKLPRPIVIGGCSQTSSNTLGRARRRGRGRRGKRGVEHRAHRVRPARVAGQAAEQPADAADIGKRVGVDAQRRDAELAQASGDTGMLGGVVEDDEIGARREDGLEVGIDAGAEVGHRGGWRRDSRTTRCGRRPRDRRRWRRAARCVAGMSETTRARGRRAPTTVSPASSTTRVPAAGEADGRQAGCQRSSAASAPNEPGCRKWKPPIPGVEDRRCATAIDAVDNATNPPPEGITGGANGEVSWLRASARLPGYPVAS